MDTKSHTNPLSQFGNKKSDEKEPDIVYIKPVDPSIKEKLHTMANLGFGAKKPCLITIELVRDAIDEWKQEKQIYSQEISQNNCTELALSFRQILQISNLDNLKLIHTLRGDNNMIMKIEGGSNLKNIKWLDLSFNYISEIEGLEALEFLSDLSGYNNQISEVNNLDMNRKLNVLSVGRNEIKDVKQMVSYLRRFGKLQALCVHMNPFCKDDDSVQKILNQNQKTITFPASYDPIIQGGHTLKYIDWKPIDEENRKQVQSRVQNPQKEEGGKNENTEEQRGQERAALHNANLDAIVDFFAIVKEKIKIEIKNGITWEKFIAIDDIEDHISLTEKTINEDIAKYQEQILEMHAKKMEVFDRKKKEGDKNEQKFIDQSKELIKAFKRKFKKFCIDGPKEGLKDVKTPDDVGIYELKRELLEIEVYAKQKLTEGISDFEKEIADHNNKMATRTEELKGALDTKKAGLKEKINDTILELQKKVTAYIDSREKGEEGKEGEQGDVPVDKKMEDLDDLFGTSDFTSDIEKVTEILENEIATLRETLDSARAKTTKNYFTKLIDEDYYRDKKRVQDIKEIYEIYWSKIDKEIKNHTSKGKSN